MNPADRHAQELLVCHLGTIPYRDALALQETIRTRRQAGELPDTLLLLEHPPVYTRGRRSRPDELTLGEDFYRARGIEVVPDRPRRARHLPRPRTARRLSDHGRHRCRRSTSARSRTRSSPRSPRKESPRARDPQDGPDYTGVWVEDRKLASLGVHVSRGISTHGFAVNVENDLQPFSWVVACGLPDVTMTSIARELQPGGTTGVACFRRRMAHHFCETFARRQRLVSPRRLGIEAPVAAARATTPRPSKPPPSTRGTTPRAHRPVTQPARADDPKIETMVPA